MSGVENILVMVASLAVVLGVLVFVHEAGHFIAAKWAGIYVHRFSLGLGAPVRALTFRRGETEYSVSWLPLGGYVKMASREEDATSAALEGGTPLAAVPPDRMFEARPLWKRFVVILAGVAMNVLFAWLVYVGLAWHRGQAIDNVTTVGAIDTASIPPGGEQLRMLHAGDRIVAAGGHRVTVWDDVSEGILRAPGDVVTVGLADGRSIQLRIHSDAIEARARAAAAIVAFRAPIVGLVAANSPAAAAGVQAHDTIVAVNGKPIAQWNELLDAVQPNPGRPVSLELAHGTRRTVQLTATTDSLGDEHGTMRPIGRIGVGLEPQFIYKPYSFPGAVKAGSAATWRSVSLLGRTLRGLVSGRVARSNLGGPILIAQQAGQMARLGPSEFLEFMAFISVNLAVLNLLPIPVLDGGQLMFLIGEAILGRPLPLKLRERLTMVGLVLILLLMVFAFWNDIRRLIEGLHR